MSILKNITGNSSVIPKDSEISCEIRQKPLVGSFCYVQYGEKNSKGHFKRGFYTTTIQEIIEQDATGISFRTLTDTFVLIY